jgi:hypothetical protein
MSMSTAEVEVPTDLVADCLPLSTCPTVELSSMWRSAASYWWIGFLDWAGRMPPQAP